MIIKVIKLNRNKNILTKPILNSERSKEYIGFIYIAFTTRNNGLIYMNIICFQ